MRSFSYPRLELSSEILDRAWDLMRRYIIPMTSIGPATTIPTWTAEISGWARIGSILANSGSSDDLTAADFVGVRRHLITGDKLYFARPARILPAWI